MNIKDYEKGIFYMLLSSSFISLLGLSAKIGLQEFSSVKISFYRYFAPLLFTLPFLWIKGELKKIKPFANLKNHLLRSLSAALAQVLMVYYLTRSTILDATMLWATGPLFIPIIMRIFYKQKVETFSWISVIVSFIGVALIIKPSRGVFDLFSLVGLGSGIAMGFSQVFWGINSEKGSVGENLFFLFLFGSLWLAAPVALEDPKGFAIPDNPIAWTMVGGLTVAAIGNQFFRSLAYKRVRPYLLTPFLYFSVVLSGLIDWAFYHKTPSFYAIVGILIVFLGAYIKWHYLRRNAL